MIYSTITNAVTGEVIIREWTPEEIAARKERFKPKEQDYSNAIQSHIDATAQSKQYADGISLASYDSSTNPTWASESQTFIAWRDGVWAYAFTELDKVKNGTRPQPSIEDFISELPQISW